MASRQESTSKDQKSKIENDLIGEVGRAVAELGIDADEPGLREVAEALAEIIESETEI